MIRKILRVYVYYLKKYKYRKNNLSENSFVNLKARLSNVSAKEFTRFAEFSDVRNSTVGAYSTIGRYSKITNASIGKFCAVSWDCTINAVSHPHTHLSIHAFPYVPHAGNFVKKRTQNHQEVNIGNDVWVGANSIIMPGVTIGDGAVVGANAVVTKDVPSYSLVVGNPGRVVGKVDKRGNRIE